jgi:hypothetical protein
MGGMLEFAAHAQEKYHDTRIQRGLVRLPTSTGSNKDVSSLLARTHNLERIQNPTKKALGFLILKPLLLQQGSLISFISS